MKRHEINEKIEGVETRVIPLSFSLDKKSIVAMQRFPIPEAGDDISFHLKHCFIGQVGEEQLIRSGIIDTEIKAAQFLAAATFAKQNSKNGKIHAICSNQLNAITSDWENAELQHQELLAADQASKKTIAVIHCVRSLDYFFFERSPRQMAMAELKRFMELPRLLNMEAWRFYCTEYNALLQQHRSQISLDAAETFAIERYIMEFHHEVNNRYIQDTMTELAKLQLSFPKQEDLFQFSYHQFVEKKKEMLLLRQDLKRMIRAHYDRLVEIVRISSMIEKSHQELIAVKKIGSVLKAALASDLGLISCENFCFVQSQIVAQLLNCELRIVSAINSDTEESRTHIAFALRLAVMQLKQLNKKEDVFELGLNWTQKAKTLHETIRKMSHHECSQWLSKELYKNSIVLFWTLVAENLKRICRSLAYNTQTTSQLSFKPKKLNQAYLSYLPPFMRNENGSFTILFRYDATGNMPKDLTDAGYDLLSQISLL